MAPMQPRAFSVACMADAKSRGYDTIWWKPLHLDSTHPVTVGGPGEMAVGKDCNEDSTPCTACPRPTTWHQGFGSMPLLPS